MEQNRLDAMNQFFISGYHTKAEQGKGSTMNITVYLGANEGMTPHSAGLFRSWGRWIGASGNALVYGGSKAGLMGLLAESVLAEGGDVTGVEAAVFCRRRTSARRPDRTDRDPRHDRAQEQDDRAG